MISSTYLISNTQETKRFSREKTGGKEGLGKRTGRSRNHWYHANLSRRHRSSAFRMSATETQGICCPTPSFPELGTNPITESQTNNQIEALRLLSPA